MGVDTKAFSKAQISKIVTSVIIEAEHIARLRHANSRLSGTNLRNSRQSRGTRKRQD